MWVKVMFGQELWALLSAYGSGIESGDTERETIWNYLDECL